MILHTKNILLAAGALLLLFLPLWAQASGISGNANERYERKLAFYNTHTRERAEITYWHNGRYIAEAQEKISWNLRDHRTQSDTQMSRDLLNLLHDIKLKLEARHPDRDIVFHVISGYRSPKTNNMLRANGGGQAKKSRHMHGDAIDIRVPGVSSKEIRDVAWCLQRGGVGYYSGSDFVHVDTHTVRFWNWSPENISCEQPGA